MMTNSTVCPNPRGCDGELYARADGLPGQWCPKCGYMLSADSASGKRAGCSNPKGCDGELYARADGITGQWCPKCGYVI
jgi:ssDNA-binding Zn-finger/Zn-ribbon topoisomerase 1